MFIINQSQVAVHKIIPPGFLTRFCTNQQSCHNWFTCPKKNLRTSTGRAYLVFGLSWALPIKGDNGEFIAIYHSLNDPKDLKVKCITEKYGEAFYGRHTALYQLQWRVMNSEKKGSHSVRGRARMISEGLRLINLTYPTYSDKQRNPDQTPQNAVSYQDLHCLPLTQQLYTHTR